MSIAKEILNVNKENKTMDEKAEKIAGIVERTKKIQELNDAMRSNLGKELPNNKFVLSHDMSDLSPDILQKVFKVVETYRNFHEDNDPYGEHDFGHFQVEGKDMYWKIDYYDHDMKHGSQDPTDEEITVRVLTIMFAHEY